MTLARSFVAASFALLVAAPAFAGTTPGATPAAPPPAAAPPAATHMEGGSVKAFVAATHALTVTVNNVDKVYNLGTVQVDPLCTKVGTLVDITLNGTTVVAVVQHKQ